MRKAEFYVPSEAMAAFADQLAGRRFNNTITGINEDGEIIIEVEYEKDQNDEVDELEEILDKLLAQLEEENEEEEEEEK